MGRKHNRVQVPVLPGDVVIDLTPVSCERSVLMTNGSGYTTVVVTGTAEAAWTWAELMGERGGIKAGEVWYPIAQQAYHGPESEDVASFEVVQQH